MSATHHVVWHGLEPRVSELPFFSLKKGSSRVSMLAFKIDLYARKIEACTVFAVVDDGKNDETRGYCILLKIQRRRVRRRRLS